MSYKTIIENQEIIPKTMYYRGKVFDIVRVDPSLIIKKYEINLKNSKIESIKLFNSHPNCNLDNSEFCLPSYIIGKEISEVKDLITYSLSVYNLENSYFMPWGLIKYEERRSKK